MAGVLAGMRGSGVKQMARAFADALAQASAADARNIALQLEVKTLQVGFWICFCRMVNSSFAISHCLY